MSCRVMEMELQVTCSATETKLRKGDKKTLQLIKAKE